MKTPHWFNRNRFFSIVRIVGAGALLSAGAALAFVAAHPVRVAAAQPTYDINTLAGKVASLRGTAGLQIRFSAFLEEEAEEPTAPPPGPLVPITPTHVLSSPLDGTTIVAPDVPGESRHRRCATERNGYCRRSE